MISDYVMTAERIKIDVEIGAYNRIYAMLMPRSPLTEVLISITT